MAAAKLLNLIAVSTLAILAASFGATPVTAVSVDTAHIGRSHAHVALAKKRRGNNSKRCKVRPTSTPANNNNNNNGGSKPTDAPKPPATTAKPAPPATTSKPSGGNNNNGGGGSHSGSDGHGKVGLGWGQNDDNALKHWKTGSVGAIITWSPWMPEITKSLGFRRCPMLWGSKQISQFQSLVKEGYADCVMGPNEPNEHTQSNMSPQDAAKLWKQYIQPLKNKGYSLISPACTNAPSGKTWMQDFLKACNGGCHLDGLAVHFYGTNPDAMISYLNDMHTTFNLPIWVTEFACQNFSGGAQCDKGQVWHFMQTVKPFMDSQNWISHYFAFGVLYDMGNVNPLNQLMDKNGQPNDLGWYYVE